MGYSNVDNPFGDTKLTQTFLWGKKLEKEGLGDASREEVESVIRSRVAQNKEELERFKKVGLAGSQVHQSKNKRRIGHTCSFLLKSAFLAEKFI